jgi:hypothetical protein
MVSLESGTKETFIGPMTVREKNRSDSMPPIAHFPVGSQHKLRSNRIFFFLYLPREAAHQQQLGHR